MVLFAQHYYARIADGIAQGDEIGKFSGVWGNGPNLDGMLPNILVDSILGACRVHDGEGYKHQGNRSGPDGYDDIHGRKIRNFPSVGPPVWVDASNV